jgi:DNA-binding transcriptional LysR family regulator
VAVTGPLVSNDGDVLIAGALDGLGLAYVTEPEVRDHLARGTLVNVLESHAIQVAGLFLYFPRASHFVPQLRAFIDCARRAAKT